MERPLPFFFQVYCEVCHFAMDNACVGCPPTRFSALKMCFSTLYTAVIWRTRAMWSLLPLDQLYPNYRQLFWIYTERKVKEVTVFQEVRSHNKCPLSQENGCAWINTAQFSFNLTAQCWSSLLPMWTHIEVLSVRHLKRELLTWAEGCCLLIAIINSTQALM